MTVPDWWEAVLLTAASFRIYRLISEDTILDRPRAWALRAGSWRPGDSARPPAAFREELATFITCPWCAGFWISGIVLAAYAIVVDWPGVFGFAVTWLAISAGVALVSKNLDPEE